MTRYRILERQTSSGEWLPRGVAFERGDVVWLWVAAPPLLNRCPVSRLEELSRHHAPTRSEWRWAGTIRRWDTVPFIPGDVLNAASLNLAGSTAGRPVRPWRPGDRADLFFDRTLVLSDTGSGLEVRYEIVHGDPAQTIRSTPQRVPFSIVERIESHRATLTENVEAVVNLQELGELLASVALPDPVRERLVAEVNEAERTERRLRLWIDPQIPTLAAWPWEYLTTPKLGGLALHPNCSLVRACGRASGSEPAVVFRSPSEPVEVLIVWSDPQTSQYPALAASRQIANITHCLDRLAHLGLRVRILRPARLESDARETATLANLCRALRERPAHAIFFLAHGAFSLEHNQGFVVLESPEPPGFAGVGADTLSGILAGSPSTRLVLLDACESASSGPRGDGRSVVQALAETGRIVLGMQFPWPAAASPLFWDIFFQILTQPCCADDALFAAREWIHYHGPQRPAWGCPALYRPYPLPPQQALERVVQLDTQVPRLRGGRLLGLTQGLLSWVRDALFRGVGRDRDLFIVQMNEQELDPLARMLAGEAGAPILTVPLWFTRLRHAPRRLSWQVEEDCGPWQVRIYRLDERDPILAERVSRPAIDLPSPLPGPVGEPIYWEVKPLGDETVPLVQGTFLVLSQQEADEVPSRGEWCGVAEGLERTLLLASSLADAGLYDELVSQLRLLAEEYPAGPTGFAIHRVLASVYAAVSEELRKRFVHGIPETEWAAALAQSHAEAAFRAL